MGDTEIDALLASSLETPVVLTLNGSTRMSVNETFNHIMMKRQVFLDHKVDGKPEVSTSIRESIVKAGQAY